MPGIFISHSHGDKQIADLLRRLIEGLFGNRYIVNYSTNKEIIGGIGPGEDWFQWIVDQVRDTDAALILLTPSSIQKPWVIWEAGAVAGAALATTDEQGKGKVIPISFGLKGGEVPHPFTHSQVLDGADRADMLKLVDALLNRLGDISRTDTLLIGNSMRGEVEEYLNSISSVIANLPIVPTEAAIQEWLERITDLEATGRSSEIAVIENWLDVAFGRDESDKERPLDVRIHRRLGELYAKSNQPADAARQFQLARQLAPRDIFVMRLLGKACLDQRDSRGAGEVIKGIEELDTKAFTHNPENAAFKARWHREKGDLLGACQTLKLAFREAPRSYYLGDLLGQTLVALDQMKEAQEVYAEVSRILAELPEQNVWTYATAMTAAAVCQNQPKFLAAAQGLRNAKPSRGQMESVGRAVSELLKVLGNLELQDQFSQIKEELEN